MKGRTPKFLKFVIVPAMAIFVLNSWLEGANPKPYEQITLPVARAAENEADPGITSPPTQVILENTTAYGTGEVPKIYPRMVWETTQDLKNLLTWFPEENHTPPDYAKVERIVVHDQGCLNPQTCTQNATNYPVATIQNIFRFHSVTKGWGDIGYNFVIDRQGRIFEGRYGGNGSRGAHLYKDATCENFNIGTAGILLLGDLRAGPMTPEQEKSLARLSAWFGATNGFDPTSTNLVTNVWKSPRNTSGSCDTTQGDFSGLFVGATLLSHGDIEAGNSDTFSLAAPRQTSGPMISAFVSLLWQAEGGTNVFTIRDGVLTPAIGTGSGISTILRTQLDFFPQSTMATLPDGTLVKSYTRDKVYRIESGKRRSIPTEDLFTALGYNWNAIQVVPDRQLALWVLGEPMPYSQGTLVKGSGEKVFAFDSGKIRHITSATLFTFLRYSWTAIKTISDFDLAGYGEASSMKFPTGTLIRGITPTVYLLDGERRRPIASSALFLARGFAWGNIQNLSAHEVVLYELGPLVLWPDGSLIKGPDNKVYWIQKGYKRWIQTADAFRTAGFSWTSVRNANTDEIAAHIEAQLIAAKADLSLEPQAITPPPSPSPPPSEPPLATPVSTEPAIRIGLKEIAVGSSVQVNFDGAFDTLKNGVLFSTQNAGDVATITPSAGETWRFVPKISTNIATVPSYTDLAWNGTNDNRFRGIIEVTASPQTGKLWLINELLMEEYLKGVSENINGQPLEYNKAFAIATRSYAHHHQKKGGKRAGEPYHLVRTPSDQYYKGYNFELRAKDPVAAVVATRGVVAMYNGKPVLAAYSSGAPGPTKSACEALSSTFCNNPDFAYLAGGVADPEGTEYKYTSCGGATHCVGIDAAGARRMAALGSLAEAILKTYYPGMTLQTLW